MRKVECAHHIECIVVIGRAYNLLMLNISSSRVLKREIQVCRNSAYAMPFDALPPSRAKEPREQTEHPSQLAQFE
jgi:hypothetical protein